AETLHTVAVHGLYPGEENRVVLRVEDPDVGFAIDTLHITTEPLPDRFPTINISVADESRMEPGWTLSEVSVSSGEGTFDTFPVIFDTNGDVRWYMDLSVNGDIAFPVRRLQNGNLLRPRGRALTEYDLLGNVINEWQLNGYRQ